MKIEKTAALNQGRFRPGTQKHVISKALHELPTGADVDDLVQAVKGLAYENLLNDYAKEHGGVEGSVHYHLRDLERLGMIRRVQDAPTETEVEDSIETTFGLERDLQRALRANIAQLEDGLTVADGGRERYVPCGKIDILALAPDGKHVVIELKAGTADRDAVGQILAYMGDLQKEVKGEVRGMLVAGDFTERAIAASTVVPSLDLKRYEFRFTFQAVP